MPCKNRLINVKFAGLCVLAVMVLNVCVEPVDIGGFMENKEVVEEVEKIQAGKSSEKVIISGDSDSDLIAGNGKITGLNTGKYYKVEELNGNGSPKYTDFVTAAGKLSGLAYIGKTNQITGLTNNVTYRVKSAKPFNDGTSLSYFNLTDSVPLKTASVNNSGTVTINTNDANCYLNLATSGSNKYIDPTKYYEVMKIPISGNDSWTGTPRTSAYRIGNNPNISHPIDLVSDTEYKRFNETLNIGIYEYDSSNKYTGTIYPSFLADMSITALPASNTENDYVFVEYYAPDLTKPNDVITRDFWFLKIIIKPELAAGSGTLTITDPQTPTDIVYAIQESGGPSGNYSLSGSAAGWVVSLTKGGTAPVITINLTTTGLTTVGWVNGQGTTLAGATAGQLNYTVNSANFSAKDTVVSVLFTRGSETLSTAPITIRFTDF